MTTADLLSRLDHVTSRGTGKWSARCPAHPDKTPSFSIVEGDRALLLRCWAGCSIQEICAVLGLKLSDLFYDQSKPRAQSKVRSHVHIDKRSVALNLDLHANAIRERGHTVLAAATGPDISAWEAGDLDRALGAIANAYHDLDRAALLEDVADGLRQRDWEERQRKRHAA